MLNTVSFNSIKFFLITGFLSTSINAQVLSGGSVGPTTSSQFASASIEAPIEGSPFVNPIYKQGNTIINGKSKTDALMRYNAYDDSIELLDENKTPRKLLRRQSIQAKFNGKTYQIFKYKESGDILESYFNPLNEGPVKLLYRPKKIFIQGEAPENGYGEVNPPRYEDISSYYLLLKDKPAVKVKLAKNQIVKHLSENKEAIKKFISTNELNLKNEGDVIKVVDYHNSLLSESLENEVESN